MRASGHVPNEVAEAKDEDGHSGELDGIRQRAVEFLDVVAKHGGERQRSEPLHEGDETGGDDRRDLPTRLPVQRIVLVVRGLGHQHSMGFATALDKVVRSKIRHQFGAWKELDMELLLDPVEHLRRRRSAHRCRPGPDGVLSPAHRNSSP